MAYKEGEHPIYKYTAEDKKEIQKELGLSEESIQEDVDVLMDWFTKQPHLAHADIDREFIERLLLFAKGSREKTKRRIDSFYKYRIRAPELIQARESVLNNNQDIWTFYNHAVMPKLYQGRRITIIEFTDPNSSHFEFDVLFRNVFMLADIRLKYDYLIGDIWILNFKNLSIGHILRLNPMVMQKAAQIFQEGIGVRVYAIHVLYAPAVANQVFNFMKQFMKPKIMDRVVTHSSLESLHKSLPKKYLPKDYGGDEPSMEEFREKMEKELKNGSKELLLNYCKRVSDESKRPGAENNEEYLVGTFKKLDFD